MDEELGVTDGISYFRIKKMSMEMDHVLYAKIKPKGNCYAYIDGIILPTK